MKRYTIKLVFYSLLPLGAFAQNPSSITETKVKVASQTTIPQVNALGAADANRKIQYLDGLGRPLQTVDRQASQSKKDIVQFFDYDALGREAKKYLPYAEPGDVDGSYKATARTNQATFYSTSSWDPHVVRTDYPLSQTVFEPSPLNRPSEQGAPGLTWQPGTRTSTTGRTVVSTYSSNTANEVLKWVLTSNGAATNNLYYAANVIYKTIIKDENWTSGKAGTVEEFKDLQKRVILKRIWESDTVSLSTYYVYDDDNHLRYVVPPAVTVSSFIENSTVFNQFIYAYHYDDKDRLIEKKIPGKGWEHMVYNGLDQLILAQDSVQRAKPTPEWSFIKYDAHGRTIMTGITTSSLTRSAYQAAADTTLNSPQWETRSDTDPSQTGYTNVSLPSVSATNCLTINYYDDYNFLGNTFGGPTGTQLIPVNGFSTGSKTAVIGTSTMLLSVSYYDSYGRVIQSKSQHYVGGTDVVDTEYHFDGSVKNTKRTHTKGTNTTVVANRFSYDDMGRKTKTYQTTYGSPKTTGNEILLSELEYNEIGQLKRKNLLEGSGTTVGSNIVLGAADIVENGQQKDVRASNSIILEPGFEARLGANFSAKISAGNYAVLYTYNERGWLKESNSPDFNMQLKYNDGSHPQYNGNIANQIYTNSSSNTFTYQYDKLNRLTSAKATGMSEILSYDVMSNITSLNRDSTGAKTYNYTGNQLQSVTGLTGAYVYDANGNATTDGRNGVLLTYNHLNLPATASKTGLSLAYTYDAMGRKLKKVSTTGTTTTTDYVDGIQYTNGTIDFIQTEEGLARNNGGIYSYEYNLSDHLGNVRVSIKDNSGTIQAFERTDYYAFGKRKFSGDNLNRYLYNGKELQEELEQYDYGARFYDPEIGRFNTIDRFAEKYYGLTSYQYGANNPILNIDVNGDSVKVNTNVSVNLSGIGLGTISIPTTVYFQGGNAYYQDGTAYNGSDTFVKQVGAALTELNKGAVGQALVGSLENSTNTTTILNDTRKQGNLAANDGRQVRWDPNGNIGGPQQGTSSLTRPSFLGLGHELAHVNDIWKGTIDRGNWFKAGTDSKGNPKYVLNAEKYATHVENWLRAEHKLPLRTHYSPDASGNPHEPSRVIAPKTNVSLFYFQLR